MTMWKKMIFGLMIVFALGMPSVLQAQEPLEPPVVDQIFRKLGRGISNVAFGVVEFPITVNRVNFEEGGFAACTYGVIRGVYDVLVREIVGIVEILTFLAPLPGCTDIPNSPAWGYGPLLKPEWILTPAQNKYNFVYPNYETMP